MPRLEARRRIIPRDFVLRHVLWSVKLPYFCRVSFPIPSPYFPEPVTVAGNVGDSGYWEVVRFSRKAAVLNLVSVAAIALLTYLWLEPNRTEWLLEVGPERIWATTILSFVGLALARVFPLGIQLALFAVFALGSSATVALWVPTIIEDFPDFAKALGWTFASGWVGLLLYNLIARRDYSFLGEYVLVWLATVVSTAVYTWLSDIVLSLAFASLVVFSAALFYYLYDLSMVLKRRRPSQWIHGALDLYRDALNFVGFPVRVMRMPRGVRRMRD